MLTLLLILAFLQPSTEVAQIARYELNGNFIEIVSCTDVVLKDCVNLGHEMSADAQMVLVGQNLSAEDETERHIQAVAINGTLVMQNVWDQ